VGLATDWNLLWHSYRRQLPACDRDVTDAPGAELLQQEGFRQARAGNLAGCERAFLETAWPDGPRDIDVLFVGNLNPAVQRERLPWVGRLARLGRRWKVVVRAGVFGDSYRKLLARSRVVFHHSARHKAGRRAIEAAAAGALIFQEQGNRELPAYFRDRQECVFYHPDELESLLEHYLEHEDERRTLAEAARVRVRGYGFEQCWQGLTEQVEQEWPALQQRDRAAAGPDGEAALTARCLQALRAVKYEDRGLIADLEQTLSQSESALGRNALGVLLGRQSQGKNHAPAAAEVAAEHFRRALEGRPGYVLAGLNLAEALDAAGQKLAAVEAARRTLEALHKEPALADADLEGMYFGRGFDFFQVEWERAAWANAGRPADEARAKRSLLGWRLYTLLAQWTGETAYWYEAALLRPDLAPGRAGLGGALARGGRLCEALPHLRQAVANNPLDRPATRALFQVMGALGDGEGRRRLAEDQSLLARAVPSLAPAEGWFSPPKPRGNELASVIVLCRNRVESTRRCLDSLLRQTRTSFELILVDNGSTDDTPAYLEEFRRAAAAGPAASRPQRVEIIRNDGDQRIARAWNQGLTAARGAYLVLVQSDVVLSPGWLEGLVGRSLHDWPGVGLVGPVANAVPGPQGVRPGNSEVPDLDAFAAQRRKAFAGKMLTVPLLQDFCLLIRREVLDRVGRLDERFEAGFAADDLCVRAREAGFRLVTALDVYVHRLGSGTGHGPAAERRETVRADFERFKEKWGQEYAAGYRGFGQDPAEEVQTATDGPEEKPTSGTEEKVQITAAPADGPSPAPAGEPAAPPAAEVSARQGVSLCMIVRNEEHHLPDCLRSVAGIFDDVVVVDTGSQDRTRAVAESFGARVFDFPWVDSFAAARNESLRHARGKWVLWLDADDRLDEENRHKLKDVLAGLGDELDAYAMKVRSVLDANRTAFRVLDQVRLFRNLPGVRWDYRIHEQILPAVNRLGGVVRWADVIIDHVGYQDAGARRGKLERNLRLLEMDHADRSKDGFTLFNLGWTMLDLGRTEEALTHLQAALEHTRPSSSTLRKLYHLLAVAYRQQQQPVRARETCQEGLKRYADDAELLCEEGLLLRDQGDLGGAEESWLRLLDTPRGQYFASEEVGLRGFRTRQLLAEVYRVRQRWVEAEVQWRAALAERADFEPAWVGLSELYNQQGRWSDLDYLLERLEGQGVAPARLGWLRARGQAQRKEYAAARRTLAHVIAQDPQALGPRVLLSQVLLQEGRDWEGAERALREVLALDPDHAETRHNLGLLLRRLGREAVAV
jgi:glycosyltransferase involved in cell wall biosynthesis